MGKLLADGEQRADAMLRPSHKDDFLERTKAAREERQMEKIRGKEWRTVIVFKWLCIGLKQDSFPKKTCSSVAEPVLF